LITLACEGAYRSGLHGHAGQPGRFVVGFTGDRAQSEAGLHGQAGGDDVQGDWQAGALGDDAARRSALICSGSHSAVSNY
jgi:hypothetical protein